MIGPTNIHDRLSLHLTDTLVPGIDGRAPIKMLHNSRGTNPNFETLGGKINITPNFKGVNCNVVFIYLFIFFLFFFFLFPWSASPGLRVLCPASNCGMKANFDPSNALSDTDSQKDTISDNNNISQFRPTPTNTPIHPNLPKSHHPWWLLFTPKL